MRCWLQRLAGGALESLEIEHSTVLETATSAVNVAHETLLYEQTALLEQVFFTVYTFKIIFKVHVRVCFKHVHELRICSIYSYM